MPLFICAKCGCIDNTATSSYWSLDLGCVSDDLEYHPTLESYKHKALCSECGLSIEVRDSIIYALKREIAKCDTAEIPVNVNFYID